MATFLDVTGLETFSNLFVFVLVWLLVYALIVYTKVLGDNKAISIIIGLIIALFVLLSPIVTGAIRYVAPWFAIIFVFVILASVVIKSFGGAASEFPAYSSFRWILIVFIIVALIVGMLSYIRDRTLYPGENETGEFEYDYKKPSNIFFHPKMLGMLFILAVAVFTIALLVGKEG